MNRTVGPSTVLVVLIGEPYFQDNRAGFRFWVKDGERNVDGLETTLHAQASHGSVVESLVIEPPDSEGFHIVERAPEGSPFDPHGGGDWDLRLVGTIEGLPVDESFRSTLPVYPRVGGSGFTPPAASPAFDPSNLPLPGILAMATGGVAIVLIGAWLIIDTRRQPRKPGKRTADPNASGS